MYINIYYIWQRDIIIESEQCPGTKSILDFRQGRLGWPGRPASRPAQPGRPSRPGRPGHPGPAGPAGAACSTFNCTPFLSSTTIL